MFKNRKISLIIKRMSLFVTVLGINTYVVNTSFGQEQTSLYQTVMSKTSAVEDPDKQVGNLDPNQAPSLPLGLVKEIGGNKYIICVDSMYFLEDGAYFSAYMAMEFPNSNKKIAFAAKDILFNPEGILGGDQAKLMLVSDHMLDLGPNTRLHLPGDGSNYVNWGCNGFESVNMHGSFIMSGNVLEPVTPGDTAVTAEFNVNVVDVNNMMATVDFSPFSVKGLDDFEFTVSQATVDMSDYQNPLNTTMPQVYYETYSDDINLWRGFHIQYFEVKLPEKMSASDSATEIYAQDMFIDEAGVTGFVGANNVLSLGDGDAGGWGFSIDNIELGFTTNELTSGSMAGEVSIPMMNDNSLEYVASVSKNPETGKPDYYFAASPGSDMTLSMPALNSTLTLYESSVLEMTVINDVFTPSLTMSGLWKVNNKNGKFEGVEFQNVHLITEAPYISSGNFALVGTLTAEIGKFSASLTQLNLGISPDGKVGIQVAGGITLGESFAVDGGFTVYTAMVEEAGKQKWQFDSFQLNSINIDISTSAISVKGGVTFMYDDPVYGDGFAGGLSISISNIIEEISLACMFGKVNGYKYFAIDAAVPVVIPLGSTGITLTQFSGGVSYHMRDTRTAQSIMDEAGNGNSSNALAPTFVPDNNISLGLRAGVQFIYTKEKLLNGEVVFSIQFNSNGGLASILLAGQAYMMVTKAERSGASGGSSNSVKGTVSVFFDNTNSIFDMQMQAEADFAGAIYANIWSQLYISPSLWYFHLGTPSNPCTVNALNLATLSAYFMFGQNLEPMPPPPPQVSSVLGGFSSTRDESTIALGNGIGTGASLYIGFDETVHVTGKWHAYATGYIGAGFDMMAVKYTSTTHCDGSSDPFGANYWYMQGQLYAYGGVGAGAKKIDDDGSILSDFPIISASMAMLLQGKLPKPSYIYGGINLQANIFNIFDLDLTLEFDAGTDCVVVN